MLNSSLVSKGIELWGHWLNIFYIWDLTWVLVAGAAQKHKDMLLFINLLIFFLGGCEDGSV